MFDFPEYVYQKILRFAKKYNLVSDCREYPSLVFNFLFFNKKISLPDIRGKLEKKFKNPSFKYGLYINFPFCRTRCNFCKYYSELDPSNFLIDDYLEALEKEIRLYDMDFFTANLNNIYLGGGTPTLLNVKQVEKLSTILNQFFPVKKYKTMQITLEGTPESVEESKMKQFHNLGIDRVSLGVQSFNDDVLRKSGRFHTSRDVFLAFDRIKNAGIKHTAIDIIFGLPGETEKSYKNTISSIKKLRPDFIECFVLTAGGRTKIKPSLGKNLNKIIDLFKEKLTEHGYSIYFFGNFLGFIKNGASPENAMNQNTEGVYKFTVPCFGIGAGAHSHFFDLKYNIFPDVKNYINTVKTQAATKLHFFGFDMNEDDSKRQYIISQIGYYRFLEKDDYFKLFDSQISDDFFNEISYLKKMRIIFEEEDKIIWQIDKMPMDHDAFFLHVIKFWYNPVYIRQLLPLINIIQ